MVQLWFNCGSKLYPRLAGGGAFPRGTVWYVEKHVEIEYYKLATRKVILGGGDAYDHHRSIIRLVFGLSNETDHGDITAASKPF